MMSQPICAMRASTLDPQFVASHVAPPRLRQRIGVALGKLATMVFFAGLTVMAAAGLWRLVTVPAWGEVMAFILGLDIPLWPERGALWGLELATLALVLGAISMGLSSLRK